MHVITQSCVLFLWMHTLTFVKSQDCTLAQFLNGPRYDLNFDTTELENSYPAGKQVRVGCNIGYSGFFKIICVEGQWQYRGTKCQPKSCGHPGDAEFADFHLEKGDDFVFGSQVVYTCHKGYQMVSRTNYRHCLAEGWDGVVPICEAQQCPVIQVDNNVQVIGDPEEANYGNVVRFSCKSSSEILKGSTEIYCDENGEWSGEAPKCKVVTCTVPVIENGFVLGEIQEYKEHDDLYFACNPKYKRSEERPSKCTKVGIRADWSPTPVCELVTCKLTLPALEGTRYEPAFRSLFSPGDTVRVICGEKYWVSTTQDNTAVSTCQDNGQWTIRPVCQEVTCRNQRHPYMSYWSVYWGQRMTLGETVRYSCKTGYKRTDGATWVTCTRDGWSPNPPCQEITCDRKDFPNADITGNYKQKYRNGEQVDYVCKRGYHGRFTLTCRENGWDGYQYCREVTCRIQYFNNADIDRSTSEYKSEYKYNEQVEYVCKNGFEGRFTLTCGETAWIGNPQCTGRRCEKLDISNAYIIRNDKESYSHNERAQYACRNDNDRKFTIICEQGVWTGIQSCADTTACPKAKVPHGFAVESNGTLYYSCDEGYKLFNKGWWGEAKCNNSKWSGLQQCIENNMCGEIPVIPNVVVKPGDHEQVQTIQITCKEGYRAKVDQLTCHKGKWHSLGSPLKEICAPVATHCKPPPKVANAVIESAYQKEYLSGSGVTYRCRNHYIIKGENTTTCIDGKWDVKDIQCISYCDRPKDEQHTLTVTEDKERYMHGDVIEYECTTPGGKTEGNATCVNGKWEKPVTCEASTQEQ